MFYFKDWTGQPDTQAGIGSEWIYIGGGSSAGVKQLGGAVAPFDDSTTLVRLTTPVTSGSEAYIEAVIPAFGTAYEIHLGFATGLTGTDLASAAVYMRATGGRIRLYRKNENSTSLAAIGTSAGNISRTLVAGDKLRFTNHAGTLIMSLNGSVIYSLADNNGLSYIYPAIRVKGDTATRLNQIKIGDYGVEAPPSSGSSGNVANLPAFVKKNGALVPAKYLGVWTGAAVAARPMTYLGKR